ncbi:MAG: hypothetical protein AAB896_02435, partial [Patescibacteria group bacterium]
PTARGLDTNKAYGVGAWQRPGGDNPGERPDGGGPLDPRGDKPNERPDGGGPSPTARAVDTNEFYAKEIREAEELAAKEKSADGAGDGGSGGGTGEVVPAVVSPTSPEKNPAATTQPQVGSGKNSPPVYTGGADAKIVDYPKPGVTVTTTKTGAVIKQSGDDKPYRMGWVDPSQGYDMKTLDDSGNDSNPYLAKTPAPASYPYSGTVDMVAAKIEAAATAPAASPAVPQKDVVTSSFQGIADVARAKGDDVMDSAPAATPLSTKGPTAPLPRHLLSFDEDLNPIGGFDPTPKAK